MHSPNVDSELVVGTLPSELSGAPHRRPMSSRQISIRARDWEGGAGWDARGGIHGVQRHSISEVSQWRTGRSSQSLPTRRRPGDGVTWTRKGTLGSIAGAGDPPGPTIQALLIARPRLSRALWASWSNRVVALVSESQVTAVAPLAGQAHITLTAPRLSRASGWSSPALSWCSPRCGSTDFTRFAGRLRCEPSVRRGTARSRAGQPSHDQAHVVCALCHRT